MKLHLSSSRISDHAEQLLELLRGGTRAALIPNAADDHPSASERAASIRRDMEELRSLGVSPVELDLRHYFGRADELAIVLEGIDLVFVRGGNTFVLRRAFEQSGADAILKDLIEQDALVYGGYSAGVCILAPSLEGIHLVDDPAVVPQGYSAPVNRNGLGILPYQVVPHYRSGHPESSAMDRVVEYYIGVHWPFIALRDGETIVIDGDRQTVLS